MKNSPHPSQPLTAAAPMNGVSRDTLDVYLQELLQSARVEDYCPNGLQVEGRAEISRIVTAVTANRSVLEAAVALNADALLVHHGYFWKREARPLTGLRKARVSLLLQHDLNLFAFHLPLDAHPTLGNNVQLAARLGIQALHTLATEPLVWIGETVADTTLEKLTQHIATVLQRTPLVLGDPQRPIRRVAWCTGGAQHYFSAACDAGVDVYLTGEISEPQYHESGESGVAFIAAGHHATERYGIQALGAHLAEKFGVSHEFIDCANPV